MRAHLGFKLTTRALFLQIGLANLSTGTAIRLLTLEALFSQRGSHAIQPSFQFNVPRKKTTYTLVVYETPAAMADDAAGIIVAHGALGCEVRKITSPRLPIRKKKLVRLHAYFERITPAALERLGAALRSAGMLANGANPAVRQLEDPGWATMWRARFEPLPVGRRFLIVPPWRRVATRDRLSIVIRPGRAFGTGHHPSTFATLSLIEEWCADRRIGRALNVGTGSGILAIAMRKLGIAQVVAIDVDATALENARENAELNGLAGGIRFSAAPLASIRGRFDLITANILSSVLIDMAPQLKARLRPGGALILAGILKREAASVVAAYCPDLRLVRTRIDKAWAALMLER